jgi:hypothetical protein
MGSNRNRFVNPIMRFDFFPQHCQIRPQIPWPSSFRYRPYFRDRKIIQ